MVFNLCSLGTRYGSEMLNNFCGMNEQGKRNNSIKQNGAEDLGLIPKGNETRINIGTLVINSKQNNNKFTS